MKLKRTVFLFLAIAVLFGITACAEKSDLPILLSAYTWETSGGDIVIRLFPQGTGETLDDGRPKAKLKWELHGNEIHIRDAEESNAPPEVFRVLESNRLVITASYDGEFIQFFNRELNR